MSVPSEEQFKWYNAVSWCWPVAQAVADEVLVELLRRAELAKQ